MVLEWLIVIGFAVGVSLTVGVVYFYNFYIKRKWPTRIPLAIQRGNSVVWDLDERARTMKTKTGYEVLRLRKRNTNIKPPKYEQVTMDMRGKSVYPIYNTVSGQYFPVKLMNTPKLEVVEDPSNKNWSILELLRTISTYRDKEGWLVKYAPFVISMAFAVMFIFFIIYFGGKFELMSNSLSNAATSLAQAMEAFKGTAPTVVP